MDVLLPVVGCAMSGRTWPGVHSQGAEQNSPRLHLGSPSQGTPAQSYSVTSYKTFISFDVKLPIKATKGQYQAHGAQ